MFDIIKNAIFSSSEDQRIIDDVKASRIESMRVVGRGTLTLDVKEVTKSEEFKGYAKAAREIVRGKAEA